MSSSPSSFDIVNSYISELYGLTKSAANPFLESAIKALRSGASKLDEVIPAGMDVAEFIKSLIKGNLASVDEVAELTGKTSDEVMSIVGDVAKPAKEVGESVVKSVAKSEILTSTKAIKQEAQKIAEIARGIDDLEGKSIEEIGRIHQELKRSRAAMKGQVTKAKNELEKSKELVSELQKEIETIKSAEEVYAKTELHVKKLEDTIEALKKQSLEASKTIESLRSSLDESQRVIKELQEKGVELTGENKRLVDELIEKSRLAGYYKGLAEASEKVAPEQARVARETAEELGRQAKSAQNAVENSEAIPKAKKQSVSESINEASEAAEQSAKQSVEESVKSGDVTTDVKKGLDELSQASKGYGQKIKDSIVWLAKRSAGVVGTGAVKYVGKGVLLGALALGVYKAYLYFFRNNKQYVIEQVSEYKKAQYDIVRKLRELDFKSDSQGQELTNRLIDTILESFKSIDFLLKEKEDITEQEYNKVIIDLNSVIDEVSGYIENKKVIELDLVSKTGFDSVIDDLTKFLNQTIKIGELATPKEQPSSGRIVEPAAMRAETTEEPAESVGTGLPQIISIYDEDIDISHLGREMRSAAPRMIEKVFNTPEGLVFVDPDNIWGGWLKQTTIADSDNNVSRNYSADYLKAFKYLFLNKIFNRVQLKQFMKQNLPKVSRKRLSGFHDALKHYRGNVEKYANQQKNDFFTQKFQKTANSLNSSVISKGNILAMNKKADKASKEYFEKAIINLDEEYAKEYYNNFRDMYDQEPADIAMDYSKLYDVNDETGAELIGAAHPKTIEVADAMGNGGVVENQIEQQRHNINVTKSMPSGNFQGRYAWVIESLVKLADSTDENGMKKASDLIDETLEELSSL